MIGSELIMLLSHYPENEVLAFNAKSKEPEPVSAIVFNAASESVELQTFRKRPREPAS